MYEFVPFSCVLVKRGSIPKILVKLSVSKARKLGIEVCGKFERYHETERVSQHDWSNEIAEAFNYGGLTYHFHYR
jgi:hypothetical protein